MGVLNLFVFVLFAPTILCFPTVVENVPPQCADPSFACQDLESARVCGVVKSCIHDIWSTMSAPEDDDDICEICKEMVKEARDQLLSNMTQEEIKEVFEGSCKLLPVELIADACIKAVDDFIPELVEMLASRMDPNMVCTVSGLCNLAHLPIHGLYKSVMSFFTHKYNHVDKCDQCTTLLVDIKKIVAGIPKEQFFHYIDGLIQLVIPDLRFDESHHVISSYYANAIHTFFISMKPKSVCAATKFCPISCEDNSKPKDELVCEFCTHVIHHVQDLITTNTTAEEFRRALTNFCKDVGKFSDKCTELVDEYFDTVFTFIRDMDAKSLCTMMSLCSSDVCSNMPLIKVIPAKMTGKRTNFAAKLIPSTPIDHVDDIHIRPLVQIYPQNTLSKKYQNDESETVNEIFDKSDNQLSLNRMADPILFLGQSLECNFCKAISFYLHLDLQENQSEENIENALNNVCTKWAHDYPDYCGRFLLKHASSIKEHIVEKSNFTSMCDHIKACPASTKEEQDIKEKPLCDLCKDTLTEIENELKDPSVKKSVEKSLYQLCNYLPKEFQSDCQNLINNNIDNVFNILIEELNADNLCPALHLCSGSVKKVIPAHIKDIECDLCKTFIQQLQEKLEEPEVKNSFKQLLDNVCNMLPSDVSSQCLDFVNQNIDSLVNIMIQDLNPNVVCTAFSLCPNSVVLKPIKYKKSNDLECELCTEVIHKLEEELENGETEEKIKMALDDLCSHFPTSFATKCQNFVNQYSTLIISLLESEMNPKMICSSLKMCSTSVIVKPTPKVSGLECDFCKEIVEKLDETLKEGSTEDEIKNALDKVCSYFPTKFAGKCENFVNQYSQLLVTILAEELDPDMVCSSLKICPAQDVECEGCQYLFHYIQEKLMDSDSQDELKILIKHVCEALPEKLDENCQAFIDEFGSQLLVLIAQNLDPSIMCNKLHICPDSNSTKIDNKPNIENLNIECGICTTVVDYMDKLLEEDDVDKELTSLVERVCSIIPSEKEKCSILIETYGPYLLQMIGQLADSKQVCKEIDMCPYTPGHVHLLGGKKCTFGPAYWCQSKIHASACKAEKYCQKNSWTE